MSTRGLLGVRIDGQDKLTYNHYDSYPTGLGHEVICAIRALHNLKSHEWIEEKSRELQLVEWGAHPDQEQFEFVKSALSGNDSVYPTDWEGLLRGSQGKLIDYLLVGYMMDSHEFINDSLFCEWAYIVNLDTGMLEVYKGFQEEQGVGRYAEAATEPDRGYWPCSLVKEYFLRDLPENLTSFQEEMYAED
jgi:hypothetical protein